MKKFISLLIGCSLALAGAAMAQQPEQTPKTKKTAPEKTTHPAGAKPERTAAAKPEVAPTRPHGARNEGTGLKEHKPEMTPKPEGRAGTETKVSGEPGASATAGAKQQAEERRRERKPATTPATANATPSVAPANQPNRPATAAGAAKKKPEPQQVQQIKAQHTNFHAQPKPQQVQAVTFNASHRVEGSERWQGSQYEVFRSYHPEWHDEGWYRSHYSRVELIAGGYYFWNNGYWYPAWGYSPSAAYYVFDGL
jgi:hypothetical protein